MKRSIIVVGAGAVGLSIAWELARRDCEVTVIERDKVGSGTTWTAAGILPPANFDKATDPMDRLRGLSHRLYPQWSERLLAETSIDIELRRCGGWYLADSPGERALMAGMTQYWDEMSIQCQSISPKSLAEQEPNLSDWVARNPTAAAWWVPDEYQIRPPRLIQALSAACEKSGVSIRENCRVVDIANNETANNETAENEKADDTNRKRSSSVTLQDQTIMTADDIVVCSGTWTGKVAERLNLQHALIPIRGQILLLKSQHPEIKGIVNVGNRYLIAREDGHTLIGSCEEEVGFDLSTDDEMLEQLYEFGVSMVPSLRQATRVSAWSGLRPMTFDGFPMIGAVPSLSQRGPSKLGQPSLWIAAGHYRSGIHLAPATAVTLADAILGCTPVVDLDAFRIGKQQIHAGRD